MLIASRVRAALWGLVEALGEWGLARVALGLLDLLLAHVHRLRGSAYLALDRASRIRRVLRVAPLERAADRLERDILQRTCLGPDGAPRPSAENRLVDDFRRGPASRALFHGGLDSWERLVRIGGELMILKEPDPATGERGVLMLKYTSAFGRFAALFDLPRVFRSYQLVLEPSWIGYHDPIFQLFYAREGQVVVEAQFPRDQEVLAASGSNLVPVPIGAGHWVSDEHFHPLPGVSRDYLACYVANWAPHKRHQLLLDALGRLEDPSARVALVGYPWKGYGRERIEREIARRGLQGRVDVYQRISRKEVNGVLNRSHCNLILSRKEGASKIFYESLAAGTPCLVIDDHRGVAPADVNDRTGMTAGAACLGSAMQLLRDEGQTLDPHGWWRENASIEASTARLEELLRELARADGRPWTRGLYRKKNDPNLFYCDPGLAERLAPAYRALGALVRPDAELAGYDLRYERPR